MKPPFAVYAGRFPHLNLEEASFEKRNEGLEANVYKVFSHSTGGYVVIKEPKALLFSNDNDPHLSALAMYRQEHALLKYLRNQGFPIPSVYAFSNDEGRPALVLEYMDGRDHEFLPTEYFVFGQALKKLHRIEIPDVPLVAMEGDSDANEVIVKRLYKRINNIQKLIKETMRLPPQKEMRSILKSLSSGRSLLHMDPRPQNILRKNDQIVAFLDWSNALIGDPLIEFARIVEYGHMHPKIIEVTADIRRIPP